MKSTRKSEVDEAFLSAYKKAEKKELKKRDSVYNDINMFQHKVKERFDVSRGMFFNSISTYQMKSHIDLQKNLDLVKNELNKIITDANTFLEKVGSYEIKIEELKKLEKQFHNCKESKKCYPHLTPNYSSSNSSSSSRSSS
jgi:hypothetical protein